MSDDHLAHVADAACAPSGRISDTSWSGIMPRTANQTDKQTGTPRTHIFGKCTPPPRPPRSSWRYPYRSGVISGTRHRGGKGFCLLWLHTTLELLTQEKSPGTLTQTISCCLKKVCSWLISRSLNGVHCLNRSLSLMLCWSGSCNKPTCCLFVCLLSSPASCIKASC